MCMLLLHNCLQYTESMCCLHYTLMIRANSCLQQSRDTTRAVNSILGRPTITTQSTRMTTPGRFTSEKYWNINYQLRKNHVWIIISTWTQVSETPFSTSKLLAPQVARQEIQAVLSQCRSYCPPEYVHSSSPCLAVHELDYIAHWKQPWHNLKITHFELTIRLSSKI
jgi:hypothetical protein